jgi:hypothetical protein
MSRVLRLDDESIADRKDGRSVRRRDAFHSVPRDRSLRFPDLKEMTRAMANHMTSKCDRRIGIRAKCALPHDQNTPAGNQELFSGATRVSRTVGLGHIP